MSNYELETAQRETARNAAEDEYFKARPQIDNHDRRKVFQAGFDRGDETLIQQLADMERKLEAAEKDAERYRWLRDESEYGDDFYLSVPFESPRDTFKPHEVDEAIDRAIEQSKGEQS